MMRWLYKLLNEPKFCSHCGTALIEERTVHRYDYYTGKPVRMKVRLHCTKGTSCFVQHGYLWIWTEKVKPKEEE